MAGSRITRYFCGALGAILIWVAMGCGSAEPREGSERRLLLGAEVKAALRKLPYDFTFRRVRRPAGAYSAVAGTAFARHDAKLNFGIAFGRSTKPVPVPRAGIKEILGYRNLFIYTNDLQVENRQGEMVPGPQIRTRAQWTEAINMSVDITDRLCRSATGETCPI
jgi:hypothetical protein